jgi:integrase
MKLTEKFIAEAKYTKTGNKQEIYWDDQIPAFGLRVFPTGTKSFILAVRVGKKRHMRTLGSTLELSLSDARVKAISETETAKITQSAPIERRGKTFEGLIELYIQRRIVKMKSGKEELRRIRKDLLPRFGKKNLWTITQDDVERLHSEVTERGKVEANRVLACLSRIINRGKEWGWLPRDFVNPTCYVIEHPERKRDRWVDADEMPKLLASIEAVDHIYIRSLFYLYLFTGARKSELLKARWENFSETGSYLRLENTKNGKDFYLHLTPESVELLNGLPRKNEWIFPGREDGKTGHLVNVYKRWASIRREAGLDNLTIHDLRRTLGSWMATNGCSLLEIGQALNQSNPETTAIYARLSKRRVEESINRVVESIIQKE